LLQGIDHRAVFLFGQADGALQFGFIDVSFNLVLQVDFGKCVWWV
jgi:hypothetical protein